jgi:glycine cleavage system H protein
MSNIPADLRYARTHEWARLNDDGSVTVGITDNAQEQLGDMVYVEVPDVGKIVKTAQSSAVVESVKAASDVYAPLDGEVMEVNSKLGDSPETVNQDAYGEGWMFRLRPSDPGQLDQLLDATAYEAFLESENH